MKQWLAYFCILIFSFQVVPVKELGKLLFKGQITEEEVVGWTHSTDENSPKVKKEADPYHTNDLDAAHARVEFLTHQLIIAIHAAEHLPKNFVPDILTPPPNC